MGHAGNFREGLVTGSGGVDRVCFVGVWRWPRRPPARGARGPRCWGDLDRLASAAETQSPAWPTCSDPQAEGGRAIRRPADTFAGHLDSRAPVGTEAFVELEEAVVTTPVSVPCPWLPRLHASWVPARRLRHSVGSWESCDGGRIFRSVLGLPEGT